MSALFYDDEVLSQYEQEGQWEKSLDYLNNIIQSKGLQKSVLYRFAAQSWYVLTFWDCNMPKEQLNREVFELGLKNAYVYAKEQWWNDSNCLWLFGYFMCINQEDFPFISDDYRDVEQYGNSLIFKAYSINPNNQLAEVLYLADSRKKRKYAAAVKNCLKSISCYFPHKSAVEQYFTGIFTNHTMD